MQIGGVNMDVRLARKCPKSCDGLIQSHREFEDAEQRGRKGKGCRGYWGRGRGWVGREGEGAWEEGKSRKYKEEVKFICHHLP